MIKKDKNFCYIDRFPPKKYKTVIHKSPSDKLELTANILKHFGSQSSSQYVTVAYDLETMLAKLDEAELKLGELRKKYVPHPVNLKSMYQ